MALSFCSGKTTPIQTTYERRHILTALNATVAQTIVGIDYYNFIEIMGKYNVLDMLTTDTFAHAQQSSACAFHSLVKLLRVLLRNTFQSLTKQ